MFYQNRNLTSNYVPISLLRCVKKIFLWIQYIFRTENTKLIVSAPLTKRTFFRWYNCFFMFNDQKETYIQHICFVANCILETLTVIFCIQEKFPIPCILFPHPKEPKCRLKTFQYVETFHLNLKKTKYSLIIQSV